MMASQASFTAPIMVKKPYPAAAAASGSSAEADGAEGDEGDEGSDSKHYLTVGWVLNHNKEAIPEPTKVALLALNHLLLGTSSAPLKKALMQSGLGEAVTGYGFEDDLLQGTYSVGLKGIANPADVDKVRQIAAVLSWLS